MGTQYSTLYSNEKKLYCSLGIDLKLHYKLLLLQGFVWSTNVEGYFLERRLLLGNLVIELFPS